MYEKVHMRPITCFMLGVLTMALLIVGAVMTVPAHAATVSSIPVNQVYTTSDSTVDDSFTYSFVAQTPSAPMPAGSSGDTFVFTMKGNTNFAIDIDTTGVPVDTYHYTLADSSEHKPGYTYDSHVYEVALFVQGDATCVVTITDPSIAKKVSVAEVDPSYAGGSPSPNVNVTKAIDKVNVAPGDVLTYTLSVVNSGNADATGIWVRDRIPAYTTYVSCNQGGEYKTDSERGYVDWFIESLPAHRSMDLVLVVKLDSGISSDVTVLNSALFSDTEKKKEDVDFTKDPDKGTTNVVEAKQGSSSSTVTSSTVKTVTTATSASSTPVSTSALTGDKGLPFAVIAVLLLSSGAVALIARRRAKLR